MIVQADASLRGLGMHVLYKTAGQLPLPAGLMTGAESWYAYIERELLTIVFACIQFNTYLQGHSFTVQSDHKLHWK